MTRKEKLLIILGIVFISFNLRAPITAVGSLVDRIQLEYELTSGMAGFITTLPLLAFATVSPFVSGISRRFGYGKTMCAGLAFILAGELIRSYTNGFGLFLGTAFLGIGIAIGNVLIPSIIKLRFPKTVGRMTSVYTTCMCTFAAVGAGASMPLADGIDLGWKNSLAFWTILAVVTLILWMPQVKADRTLVIDTADSKDEKKQSSGSIWKSPIAWWVTLFMGTQSLIFYSLVAWLPTIIVSKGMSGSFAGTMALVFQLASIPATLMIPMLCDKFKNQRSLAFIICLLYIIGMLLFLFGSSEVLMVAAVLLMSLGMGGSISLSIAFISLRSPNAARASELSGMSQSAGYLFAAVGPILVGMLYDVTQSWTIPILIFTGLILLLAFCGSYAGNDVTVQEQETKLATKESYPIG